MSHINEVKDVDEVIPEAKVMIQSLRAFGYNITTAIADLIDNSITACAQNIWINFHWGGENSYISITDDGKGMTEKDLINAMKPGSQSPLIARDPKDLGRFGLGLKTASFSQCKRLTVATKAKSAPIFIRMWDLDYVSDINRWHLLRTVCKGSEKRIEHLNNLETGTVVLWECLDRIVGDSPIFDRSAHDRFLSVINTVEEHLSMVFHKYLEGPKPRLKIFINGVNEEQRVKSWDPFLEDHPATIPFPDESISLGSGVVNIKGFVLPHKDKLNEHQYKNAAGPSGWNAQQGFYIYRNNRLLVAGSWLGLGSPKPWTKEEHYKLARISVNIPNSLDIDWQIDVKKSVARPPAAIRERLKALALSVRSQAREIFAHRGSYGVRREQEPFVRAWLPENSQGFISYKIDRSHPLVKQLLSECPEKNQLINALLRLLEETVPVQQIWLDAAEKPDMHSRPFAKAPDAEVNEMIKLTYRALRRADKMTQKEAIQRLLRMEAFIDFSSYIESIISELEG